MTLVSLLGWLLSDATKPALGRAEVRGMTGRDGGLMGKSSEGSDPTGGFWCVLPGEVTHVRGSHVPPHLQDF